MTARAPAGDGRETAVWAELTDMASASSAGSGRGRYLECEDCGFLADESQIDERPADGRAVAQGERVCPVCHGRAFPVPIRHAA